MLGLALRAARLGHVTAPRAAGVRIAYAAVPARVRVWVDELLGSPVVSTAEQVGGMSPGNATRVVCADGSRAFVKAVGPELNPDTPGLFRRERSVLELIGNHPLWADLQAAYDDGDWVALVLEDVEGGHVDLTDDAAMDALLDATDRLVAVLHERVPDPPAPGPHGPQLLPDRFSLWADAVADVGALPAGVVPDWLRARGPRLAAEVRALALEPADHLGHWDIRNDNLLQRPTGEIVFVDWGMAALGPDWADPLLARVERVEDPWFDASLSGSPALARVGDDAVTAWLVGIGGFLAHRSHTAVDVNLPTLNDFRIRESRRFLGAAARRLGLG